jgi:hypothetical protein
MDTGGAEQVTNLVKCVKFWPRAQGLSVLTKYCPSRRSRVNHNDWNIPQLDLIHGTKLFCPPSILLGSICSDLPYISNDWKSTGTLEACNSSTVPLNLSEEDVEGNIEKNKVSQSREWVLSRESSDTFNLIGEHVGSAQSSIDTDQLEVSVQETSESNILIFADRALLLSV